VRDIDKNVFVCSSNNGQKKESILYLELYQAYDESKLEIRQLENHTVFHIPWLPSFFFTSNRFLAIIADEEIPTQVENPNVRTHIAPSHMYHNYDSR